MRFLNQFNEFNFVQFSEGKTFNVVEVAPWQDYKTKELLGTEVTVVIMTDNTNYGEKKTGTNRFEKLKFKLRKQVDVPVDAQVIPINPVGKVYGDFNQNLSVHCDDIRPCHPSFAFY